MGHLGGTDCLSDIDSLPHFPPVTLFNGGRFFSVPELMMYLSGLLNSESVVLVTRSIKMISGGAGGSKIAAYIFCE